MGEGLLVLVYGDKLMLSLFRVLKLFPSVGTDVIKHYNTVGVH